jgi:hypothetical protein
MDEEAGQYVGHIPSRGEEADASFVHRVARLT